MEEPRPESQRSFHSGGALSDSEATPLAKSQPRPKHGWFRRRHSLAFGDKHEMPWTWRFEDALNTMGTSAFVVNMFADLCPPGLLPLAFGLQATGYLPALLILMVLCTMCVYTMWTVSRTAEITGGYTFRAQWASTLGEQTSWIPVAVVVLVCFGCCLAYSCFFADILTGVMAAFGVRASRSEWLWIFSLFPVLPLCMLKDLSALAYTSGAAFLVVVYTTIVMCYRAVDGSYSEHGIFWKDLHPKPDFPEDRFWSCGIGSLTLVNFLAMAYLSHYNGCKYYRELRNHTPMRFSMCTSIGMGVTSLFYVVTTLAAFETFGKSAKGVILENYSKNDLLANIARLGMGLSIIASFPLMFSGLREASIELLSMIWPIFGDSLQQVGKQNVLSTLILILVTSCAWVSTDAGLVVGLVGAICGSAIIYIIPCVLYASALSHVLTKSDHIIEITIASSMACVGAVLGAVGVLSALAS